MNHTHPIRNIRGLLLLSLLILAVGTLPACGKKTIRTEVGEAENASATPEATPGDEVTTADTSSEETTSASDSEMVSAADATETESLAPATAAEEAPAETAKEAAPATEPASTDFVEKAPAETAAASAQPSPTPMVVASTEGNPPAETAASPLDSTPVDAPQPKADFPWLWVILLILVGVGAWYYWRSKKTTRSPSMLQPHPPLGGLSPVSGYTGRRRR